MRNLRNVCDTLNLDFNVIKYIFNKYLTQKYDNIIVDMNRPSQKIRKKFTEITAI